ncbi:hypothetical protein [Natronomonas marina]|jgi:hypothetical protein|uniref:hypothetical protein n=1 Tax=Natronomonas marina TaxID=2961939 RepID=UPI0020C94505|nr:hypothetical protein [Natronomonas marina]
MLRPPGGRSVPVVASVVAAFVAVDPAAAQTTNPEAVGTSIVLNAIVSGVFGLVVAGGIVALAPDYAERTTDRIRTNPGGTFLYGLAIGIAAVIVGFLLALTIVGILVAVPMFIVLGVVGYLGHLAAGRSVSDDWGVAVLVAVVLAVVTGAIPILGGLLGFVLSSLGIGAAYLDYKDDGRSGRGRKSRNHGGRDRRVRDRGDDDRRPIGNHDRSGTDGEDDPGGPR